MLTIVSSWTGIAAHHRIVLHEHQGSPSSPGRASRLTIVSSWTSIKVLTIVLDGHRGSPSYRPARASRCSPSSWTGIAAHRRIVLHEHQGAHHRPGRASRLTIVSSCTSIKVLTIVLDGHRGSPSYRPARASRCSPSYRPARASRSATHESGRHRLTGQNIRNLHNSRTRLGRRTEKLTPCTARRVYYLLQGPPARRWLRWPVSPNE